LNYLEGVAASFHERVADCGGDATVDAVHRVRTGARQLEALLKVFADPSIASNLESRADASISRPPLAAGQAEARRATLQPLRAPARDWLRQLKKIRRAAGPVRDLDVRRRLLRAWMRDASGRRGKTRPASPGARRHRSVSSNDASEVALDIPLGWRLRESLAERRDTLAAKLSRTMEHRSLKLERRRQAFFFAARQLSGGDAACPAGEGSLALREFLRAAETMPKLSAANLHRFRKEVKRARYLAESEAADPTARSFAKALKRVQDRIGAWRDWQGLSAEAESALGEPGQPMVLAFRRRAEECAGDAVRAAAKAVSEARRRLAAEMPATRSRGGRRPPGRAGSPAPQGRAAPGAGSAA
jgi:CHAD domain-containing protein